MHQEYDRRHGQVSQHIHLHSIHTRSLPTLSASVYMGADASLCLVFDDVSPSWFAWVFLIGEVVITLSAWQSHCSRFFPVKRSRCTMDDLVKVQSPLSPHRPHTQKPLS
jgi:hypothetical protein